ncbi:cell wall-binding repeat-containing protein [Herbiconiux sp. YIM B11900]|uniref:cell wall-binding repeat-containing protein n=1 Tax=Herbiconiux sp. YIM B11900 TaxID=3404131 RepID=UPI003F855D91
MPIVSHRFVTPQPGESVRVALAGTIPDGLTFTETLEGTPRTAQFADLTVTATVTAGDGSTASASVPCRMWVKPQPAVSRTAGVDRYDQSVQVSRFTFSSPTSFVYLASGEKFADALSATTIAAMHRSPLLLTSAASVTSGVIEEIRRLKPEKVVIVGGPASISDAVIAQLGASAISPDAIERVGGADRYAVSRNLVTHPEFGARNALGVFLAAGATFPDALSASSAAYNMSSVVLLVDGSETSLKSSEAAVIKSLRATKVYLVGGPVSLSPALEADVTRSYPTVRYGGADRFAVSQAVNSASFLDVKNVFIASAAVYPDALSGGVLAGLANAPMMITQKDCLTRGQATLLGQLGVTGVTILGGPASVGPEVERLAVCP